MGLLKKIYRRLFGESLETYKSKFEEKIKGNRVNAFYTNNNGDSHHTNSECNSGKAIPDHNWESGKVGLKECLECRRNNGDSD